MILENSLRVAEQISIPLALPLILGNKDYYEHKALLENIDLLLIQSGLEHRAQEHFLKLALEKAKKEKKKLSIRKRASIQGMVSQALRCNIARILSGESFRDFSFHLGDSLILQKFCRIIDFDLVQVPGKSSLQNYSEMFSEEELRTWVGDLNLAAQKGTLGLKEVFDLGFHWLDSTCLETNIHFPVDWVLLRDLVRTLSKAIDCIRRHGLKSRIQEPGKFRSQMNSYCIAMTQSKKGEKARNVRKNILRKMNKLTKCVEQHAIRYRDLLKEEWKTTDLSEKESNQIIHRIEGMLEQLPAAIHQAHERIIGERLVANKDKILSLYEQHTQVYHRGKAGQQTEFGLQLLLAESAGGLITDWELVEGSPKNDTQHLKPAVERLRAAGIEVKGLVGDKGFVSKDNSDYLLEEKIEDYLCPKNVVQLKAKQEDKEFIKQQKRRAQTEGRIGILKNEFIGKQLPVKGMGRQKKHVGLSILSHNLWLLARALSKEEAEELKQAA